MKKIFISIFFVIQLSFCTLAAGWLHVGNDSFWVLDDGSFATGFIFDADKVYYADDNGKVYKATASGTYRMISDNHYTNQFFVDEFGVVSMNNAKEPHWCKMNNTWYHYGANNVLDRNKWLIDTKNKRIFRVDYDGKLCHGWVADPDTHIEYYYDMDPDGGQLLADSSGTPYEEMYEMILATCNMDEKYTEEIYNAPSATLDDRNDLTDTPAPKNLDEKPVEIGVIWAVGN